MYSFVSTARTHSRYGLGFSIVEKIAALYGGRVDLGRSERLGGFRVAVILLVEAGLDTGLESRGTVIFSRTATVSEITCRLPQACLTVDPAGEG